MAATEGVVEDKDAGGSGGGDRNQGQQQQPRRDKGNSGGGGKGNNQPPKPIKGAGYIYLARAAVFAINTGLNYASLWFFLAPVEIQELGINRVENVTPFWASNYMWILWLCATLIQITLLFVPMFIADNVWYRNWRNRLQNLDTAFNYVGTLVVLTLFMGIGREVLLVVRAVYEAMDSVVRAFGSSLNVGTLMLLFAVYAFSDGVRMLSVITELVPKKR